MCLKRKSETFVATDDTQTQKPNIIVFCINCHSERGATGKFKCFIKGITPLPFQDLNDAHNACVCVCQKYLFFVVYLI